MNAVKLYILSILLLLSTQLFGQDKQTQHRISGFVRDASSGESIIGATISNSSGKGDISNQYGFYSIIVEANDSLTVRFLGYKTLTQAAYANDTTINILLQPESYELTDVVVTANNRTLTTISSKGKVSMNIKEMQYAPSFTGGQDVFKYLQIIPGVSSGDDGSSNIHIRGSSADQTQILLDDVPIYNQSHAFGYASIFSAEAVKTLDLYKGYSSPYYGGRLAGVVSMRMRDGNSYEHKQSVQVGLTTMSANAEGSINNGRGTYLFSGRIFSFYPFLKLGYSLMSEEKRAGAPTFNFYDLVGKITYNLNDKNKLFVSAYSGNDFFMMEEHVTHQSNTISPSEQNNNDLLTSTISNMSWGNTVFSLRLNTTLSKRLFMNNIAYYSYLGNKLNSEYTEKRYNTNYSANISSHMNELGYKVNFDYKVSSAYNLEFGAHYSNQNFEPQQMQTLINNNIVKSGNTPTKELSTYAAYLNNRVNYKNMELNVGARASVYDNGSAYRNAIDPRISLSYTVNNSFSVWGSYVQNNQPLFSLNKHFYSVPIDYWAPYTDNELQTSTQYSLGAKRNIGSRLNASLEVYTKQSRNLTLIHDSDEFLVNSEGYVKGNGNAYGLELMMQYRHNKLSLTGSYAYSKSDITIDGVTMPYIYDTPHAANLLGMYEVKKTDTRKHTISMNIAYKTGRPYYISNDVYAPTYDFESSDNGILHYSETTYIRLKDYFRADVAYSMEKKLRRGSRIWQFSIANLTAYNNPYIVVRSGDALKAYTIVPFLPTFSYTRKF